MNAFGSTEVLAQREVQLHSHLALSQNFYTLHISSEIKLGLTEHPNDLLIL